MRVCDVLALNIREVRAKHGLTLDAIATESRKLGTKWTSAYMSRMEHAGVDAVQVDDVCVLSLALTRLTGQPVTVLDLLAHHGLVDLTESASIAGADFPSILGGANPSPIINVGESSTLPLADQRIAAKLGMEPDDYRARCLSLWGHLLSDESARITPPNSTAQKQGHATRKLMSELV